MNAWVRPELPTASVGSSQAPTDAVDNSAPCAIRPEPTYKSGNVVQTTGATSIASLLAAALFPTLAEIGSTTLVRLIGWLPLKGKTNLSGTWSSTWFVDSPRFSPSNTDEDSEIRQLGNRVYMQHNADGIMFRASGRIDSGRYVTGVWFDETDGGYHGAFQLVIDPKTRNMSGEWVGYSTEGFVKHGKWVWVQKRPNPAVQGTLRDKAAQRP